MRIDIRLVVKNYEGKDMKTRDKDNKEIPLTVRRALNFVINGVALRPDGRAQILTEEGRGKIYQLSTKLWSVKKEVDFTSSEVTFIRVRAGKVSNITPLLYGRVCDLLEGKSEEKPETTDEKEEPELKPEANPEVTPKENEG